MAAILPYAEPRTESEAKFSIPHAVAVAIATDRVGLAAFEPSTIDSAVVRRLRERVDYRVDETVPRGSYAVTVTIETTDGETYTRSADTPPATMADPLSDAELEAKFRACATRTVSAAVADRAYGQLDGLRALESVPTLGETLAG
jgi:2-methylcitrate dehydratase PrpD